MANRIRRPQSDASGADPLLSVLVEVEVPRYGFVKRLGDGTVDYVSPLPSPFNYGAVPDSHAPDGDRLDVVLLGPRRAAGSRLTAPVRGLVHFVDAGEPDPKLVVGLEPPTRGDLRRIHAFFAAYAHAKGILNRARGKEGPTRMDGLDVPADPTLLKGWLDR